MTEAISANKLELLQIAEAVAREKTISRDIVLEAMAEAIQRAAKSRYGAENDIRADINADTGEINLRRYIKVVEEVENPAREITLADAKKQDKDIEAEGYLTEELPPIEFGRIATQSAKQVIVQKVRDAERQQQFEEFKDRVGEIISGAVKRVEYGNVIIDIGRGEAVIHRNSLIPREAFRVGERVRAYIQDVRREARAPQVLLSRTDPEFMKKLFEQEVPEVYDGIIEIKAVARDPGSRAKIAVISNDGSIDPVGACVGMRGSRVQAVVNELQGEKVDIIPFSPDPVAFIVNGLAPAEVAKVVLDEDAKRIEVVVPDEQLSLAIGRRGQNVRLASQLTGWDIDILTEAEESERRQEEFTSRTALFMKALDVDEMIAQLLASEGFTSIEEIAYVPLSEISDIEGFEEETAEEIQNRGRDYIDQVNAAHDEERKKMGVSDALAEIAGITPAMLVALGKQELLSLEDFAGCVPDDLLGWVERKDGEKTIHSGLLEGFELTPEQAQELIMKARIAAGWVEEKDLIAAAEAEAAAEAAAEAEAKAAAEAEAEAKIEAEAKAEAKAKAEATTGEQE
ncbi:MAG: transcription termination factor NusA [Parvibaculales bacterium]